MEFNQLTDHDKHIIYQAMKVLLDQDNWIDDKEFQTRLGIYRRELSEVINVWPEIDNTDEIVVLAINNSLCEICYGINISQIVWEKHFDFSKMEAEQVCLKLKMGNG